MVVDRDTTQARLAKLTSATLQHTPSQRYTVGDRVEERAAELGSRPFLLFEDRALSYSELNAEANRVAHAAQREGLAHGDVVALMMENRPEFITTWMGLAKLGVVSALSNTHARGPALRHALEVTGARHWILGSECLEALTSLDSGAVERTLRFVLEDPNHGARAGKLPPGVRDLAAVLAEMSTENPNPALRRDLVQMGHTLQINVGSYGGYQGILLDVKNRVYYGASESRKDGQAAGY